MVYVLMFLGWRLWESLPHPCGPFLAAWRAKAPPPLTCVGAVELAALGQPRKMGNKC